MLVFSGLNLILDVVNVTCLARAGQAEGLPVGLVVSAINSRTQQQRQHHHEDLKEAPSNETPTELSNLIWKAATANKKTTIPSGSTANDEDESSALSPHHYETNLNMCSAWTHICADTLRTVAVLVAAGIATLFPASLSPIDADSCGAIIVSLIIFAGLIPLIEGLWQTAHEIRKL